MRITDITRPLSDATVPYPGDLPPRFVQEDRGPYLISELRLSSHSGTHIDAPVHYLKEGPAIDEIPLASLIGPCRVLDVTGAGSAIDPPALEGRTKGARRILLKTAASGSSAFREDYPALTPAAARYLTGERVICIGIDSFSIEAFAGDGSVHRELLGRGCSIIELLDLAGVAEGEYTLAALPLRLAGLDGAPARVVLLDGEGCESWT